MKHIVLFIAAIITTGAGLVLAGHFTRAPLVMEIEDRVLRKLAQWNLPGGRTLLEIGRARLPAVLANHGRKLGDPVFIRIYKKQARLEVWMDGDGGYVQVADYPICRWSGDLGPKLKEGDRQSPEGFYEVSARQLNPNSRHHRAFNIGFPNAYDRHHNRTGTFLMVHGGCSSIGCYAISDLAVDKVYSIVEAALGGGQTSVPVHIFPFEMSDAKLDALAGSKWEAFWRNLKIGHDLFAETGRPPAVSVCDGAYVFNENRASDCRMVRAW